jgi:glyoxalase family protein
MPTTALGIHHLTAIAGDPQRNVDFYAGTLGLRFVKKTVNFDDPFTYHLYYGDGSGGPGSLLTFFPWPAGRTGRQGVGQVNVVSLAILPASLGWWVERLLTHGIAHEAPATKFGRRVLAFRDPDGMPLELVADPAAESRAGWTGGPVPADHIVRGMHGVTLWVGSAAATAALLTETLGFRAAGEEAGVQRFVSGDGGPGTVVDVRAAEGFWAGTMGAGVIHHVAFRAANDDAQDELRQAVQQAGIATTPRIDRTYFHSVYFHEPGGVLFEIATDGPGFAIDEPADRLGSALKLPAQYESARAQIEAQLLPIHLPAEIAG